MNSHDIYLHNYLMVRPPVKWIAFFVLGVSLIAGVATIITRFEQLQYLVSTYYHPSYLVGGSR